MAEQKKDKEMLRHFASLPREDFLRALWAAEGLVPENQAPPKDREAAAAAWELFLAHERGLNFRPVVVPDRVPELSSRPPRVLESKHWLRIAAAVLVTIGATWAALTAFRNVPELTGTLWIEKPLLDGRDLAATNEAGPIRAPALIRFREGTIDLQSGTLSLHGRPSGGYEVATMRARAVLLFHQPFALRIVHPDLTLEMTGTEFDYEVQDRRGSILLREGSLRARHHPSDGPDQDLEIRGPHRLIFDGPRLYSFSLDPALGPLSSGDRAETGRADGSSQSNQDQSRARAIAGPPDGPGPVDEATGERPAAETGAVDSDETRRARDAFQMAAGLGTQAPGIGPARITPAVRPDAQQPRATGESRPGPRIAPADRPLQLFTMRDRRAYYGYVIERDTTFMTIETQEGQVRRLPLSELVSADVIP